MKTKILLFVLLGAFMTGCVSTKNIPITDEKLGSMKGSSLAISKRKLPDFSAMTAGKAMFGGLGGVAMISAGNKIVKENAIEDPALYIAATISSGLMQHHELTVDADVSVTVSGNSSSKIAKMNFSTDYLLDIQTVNWSFAYFPTDWDNYRVIYSAKLRLIEKTSQKVVAEGFCSRVPDQDENSPSYDQLLADKAARLKSELRIAADKCISEFKSDILNI